MRPRPGAPSRQSERRAAGGARRAPEGYRPFAYSSAESLSQSVPALLFWM